MKEKVMFSSQKQDWETPEKLFKKLDDVFHFQTDVCATKENTKCHKHYTPEIDGLKQEWTGVCWMNPPYGYQIDKWIQKAYNSAKENGTTVVCLLPARTDTKWWHEYVTKAEVYFIKGRLKFSGHKNSAPFPSTVVVFRPQIEDAFK